MLTVMALSALLSAQAAFAIENYGPAKANETLWSIANSHHPAKVTVDQTALAIVKLNPKAFKGADYVLVPHSYLKLPTSSTEVKSALGFNAKKLEKPKAKLQPKPFVSHPVQASTQTAAAQITQLTAQLNAANQKVDLLEQQLDNGNSFPWASLWFILWALTGISLYMVYRHYKRDQTGEEDPALNAQLKEAREKTEPIIISVSEKEPENPFEQGELDLPADEASPVQESLQSAAEEETDAKEPEEIPATPEVEALLKQIETDPYNLELRMQLLELYVSASDQAGFNLQFRDMLNHNLMMEGDEVWTKVRTLYLNTWIYA